MALHLQSHVLLSTLLTVLLSLTSASSLPNSVPTSHWQHLALKTRGSFLTDISGSPFFWQADTAWELFHRLSQSEVISYLDDRKAKGFNVIMSVVLAEYNVTTPNRNGDLALIDLDPTKPNEKYFEYVDWCVDRATERGLRIAMVPTWGRYVNGGWHGSPILFTNESTAITYGTYIAHRYAGLPKIIGADSNRWWATNLTEFSADQALNTNQTTDVSGINNITYSDTGNIWNALATAMLEVEGDLSFITYHPTSQWPTKFAPATGYSQYQDVPGSEKWLKMDAVQSSHECINPVPGVGHWCGSRNYEPVELMWNNSLGVRPIMDLENHYEGGWFNIKPSLSVGRIWNDSDVRTGAWTAVFGGAAGATYGAWSIWQFWNPDLYDNITVATFPLCSSPNLPSVSASDSEFSTCTNSTEPIGMTWQDELILPGSRQMQHLQSFISNTSFGPGKYYFDRVPDNKAISTDLGESEGRFSATRDKEGRWVAVYSPQGFSFGVDLRYLEKILGGGSNETQRWFSPQGFSFGVDLGYLGYLGKILGGESNKTVSWTQRWFSPRDGTYGGESVGSGGGMRMFEPPTSGGVDYDWVLLLDDIALA